MAMLVRYMEKTEYGQYAFVLTCIQLFSITGLTGAGEAILQSIARGFYGTYRALTSLALKLSILGTVLLAIMGASHYWLGLDSTSISFFVAAVCFPLGWASEKWEYALKAEGRFRTVALIRSTLLAFNLVVLLALIKFDQLSVVTAIATTQLSLAAVNLLMTFLTLKRLGTTGQIEPSSIKYALHTTGYAIPDQIANHFDKFILYFFVSPDALALYFVAERIPEVMKKNVQAFTSVFIPTLAKKKIYTVELSRKLNAVASGFGILVICLAIFVIPWALPILFGEKYNKAVLYCQMLMASIAVGAFSTIKFSFIRAKFDLRGYRNVVLWMSLSRIIFAALLTPAFGAMGAATATILYRFTTLTLVEANLNRHRSQDKSLGIEIPVK